jgi:hypothetical protein
MAKKPVIGLSTHQFTCGKSNKFTIYGANFTKNVNVKLEETRHGKDHVWVIQKVTSNATPGSDDGTEITVEATPTKRNGTPCDARPVGDLTVTVTNNGGPSTAANSNDVHYSP